MLVSKLIFNQGDLAQGFFIILEGNVEVIRENDGSTESVAILGPGDYFGEMSLLYWVRHTATIRAMTTVDVVVMNGNDFKLLANSSSDFKELFGKAMQQRLSGLGVESPNELGRSGRDQTTDNGNG